jgi:hypothetical protein
MSAPFSAKAKIQVPTGPRASPRDAQKNSPGGSRGFGGTSKNTYAGMLDTTTDAVENNLARQPRRDKLIPCKACPRRPENLGREFISCDHLRT